MTAGIADATYVAALGIADQCREKATECLQDADEVFDAPRPRTRVERDAAQLGIEAGITGTFLTLIRLGMLRGSSASERTA